MDTSMGQVARVAAGFVAFVLACAAAGYWSISSWADEAPVAVDSASESEPETAAPAAMAGAGLRLHVSVPRHVVPGHRSPITVSVRSSDGSLLPADTRLVVYAVVDGTGDQSAQAIVSGPAARPVAAGDLARSPLYLVPAGSPACDQVIGELKVRVVTVAQTPAEAEQVRPVHGPPCGAPDVVPASESLHHDEPVRVEGHGWHGDLERLMTEPQPEATPERRRPARTRPTPQASEPAEPEPEPAPSETEQPEPKPEPEPEPKPEPKPEPEPEPEPTETEKPKPGPKPTESEQPKPDPKPEPPPEESAGTDE